MLSRYGISGIGGIDTRRLTRLLRDTGAMPGAFGTADEAIAARRGGRRAGHRRHRSRRRGHHDAPYAVHAVGAGDAADRRLRLRHQAHDPAPPRRARHGRGGARRRRRPPRCWLASPTACSCPTARATRRWSATRSTRSRELLGQVPIFGICLGHQLLSRALGGETFKLPFGHHGGNHPVRHEPPGTSRSPARTTTSASTPTSLAGKVDGHPRQPQRQHQRGHAGARRRRRSACSTTPRPGPGRTTSQYLFDDVRRA